jgi:hypothetical protein
LIKNALLRLAHHIYSLILAANLHDWKVHISWQWSDVEKLFPLTTNTFSRSQQVGWWMWKTECSSRRFSVLSVDMSVSKIHSICRLWQKLLHSYSVLATAEKLAKTMLFIYLLLVIL